MTQFHPRAVIFDLGCTLIEYEAIGWDELAKDAVASGHEFLKRKGVVTEEYAEFYDAYIAIRDRYRQRAVRELREWTIQDAIRDLLIQLKQPADDGLVEGFFDAYYGPVAEQLYVYDDTIDTLEHVTANYDTVGLISNTIFPARTHKGELDRFGLRNFFSFEVYSSEFGTRKPHPDIFYKAANLCGLAPSECVYIGDRYREDVQGPTGIGMSGILKRLDSREYPEEMPEAVAQISTLSELIDIL